MILKCKLNGMEHVVEMDNLEVSTVLNRLWCGACEQADRTGKPVDSTSCGKVHLILACLQMPDGVTRVTTTGEDKILAVNVTKTAREILRDPDAEDQFTVSLLENTTAGPIFETSVAEEIERLKFEGGQAK